MSGTATHELPGRSVERRPGSPATAFRVTLLVLCSLLSVLSDEQTFAAVPIALLSAYVVAVDRSRFARRHVILSCRLEALVTGAAVALSGGAESPMLPYLLAPLLALGLAAGSYEVVLASGAAVMGLAGGRLLAVTSDLILSGPLSDFIAAAGQWLVIGAALGLVAAWAQRLTLGEPVTADDRYSEARSLLEQLRGVTRSLPGGLDVTASAEALLEQSAEVVTTHRSAVLVQPAPGSLVPAAIRGTKRVPWRAPLSEPGPLQRAWDGRVAVVDHRPPDEHGRRRGSTLAVFPLTTGHEPIGLLILESFQEGAFPTGVLAQIQGCADRGALRLATAMLFEEVRSTVTLEERDRLAREMHDGVAQEIAFVGYQLDELRGQAARLDSGLADSITEVRRGLTRLISDIRLSITDLKTSVSNDRGLGSAITGYVRAVASGQPLAVHLTLQESAFRLTGDVEVLLLQITQAVAQDARKAGQADNLWVTLTVDPPSALLCVRHDGGLVDASALDLSEYSESLARLGGSLDVSVRPGEGVTVEAALQRGD